MALLDFLALGFIAGLIVVSWQCFKDPPWEGFSPIKFIRSFIISSIVAISLYILHQIQVLKETNSGIILLSIICFERAIGEIYKGFFKGQHQEYNEVFKHYGLGLKKQYARILLGTLFLLLITGIFYLFTQIPHALEAWTENKILLGALLGVIGGLTVATGGSLKDTTFEDFNPLKFIRSPLAGMLGGILLVQVAQTNELIIFATIGFERVFVEFYKTFYRKHKRGIFEGKRPSHPKWLKIRWIFLNTYFFGVYWLVVTLL